jgi:sugar lactone lactonase YvrE
VTDAQGAYRVEGELPARNLIVAVDLGSKGQLQAIAPKGATQADADLVSTLTSTYILDQFVKGQRDPLETLDKLPADVEAQTRAKAAVALGAAGVAPPDLQPAALVKAVEDLRKADAGFDAQMEEVKKLLVAVGQSDLGNGRPARDVRLRAIRALVPTSDGGAYFSCPSDHRVWKLQPDGTLATAAGSGSARDEAVIEGVAAVDAPLNRPYGLVLDAQDRLLILEHQGAGDRLTRLGPDGKLHVLWTGPGLLAVAPLAGDDVKLLLADGLRWVKPGATLEQLGALDATKFKDVARATSFGVDAQGRVTLGVPGDPGQVFMLDATGLDGKVLAEDPAGVNHLAVEAGGRLLGTVRTPDGLTLVQVDPSGARTTLLPSLPTASYLDSMQACALLPDGRAMLVQRGNVLYATNANGLGRVAGVQEPPNGNARDVAIDTPNGMAVGKQGELYLCDKSTNLILRVDPDGKVTTLSGTGVQGMAGDGGPATMAQQNVPRAIRIDDAGNLYVLQGGVGETVRKIANGIITTAFKSPSGLYIRDLSVTHDGKAFLALKAHNDGPTSVIRMDPDGTTTTVLAPQALEGEILAVGPGDVLWMLVGDQGKRTLMTWTEAAGTKVIKEDARFAANYPNDSNGLAIDAKGRAIITLWGKDQVWVYDPDKDATTLVAGVGGSHFGGDAVDDGIEAPRYPTIGPQGELLFSDTHHHQVKRLPMGEY